MKNKLAKIKYLPNNYEIIEPGDHVICAISNKKIMLELQKEIIRTLKEGLNNVS